MVAVVLTKTQCGFHQLGRIYLLTYDLPIPPFTSRRERGRRYLYSLSETSAVILRMIQDVVSHLVYSCALYVGWRSVGYSVQLWLPL